MKSDWEIRLDWEMKSGGEMKSDWEMKSGGEMYAAQSDFSHMFL